MLCSTAIFEEVISVAASFLTTFDNSDSLMDLHFMTERPEIITAGRGFAQTSQQLEALAVLQQTRQATDALHEMLIERSRLMSGCLFVFAGMDSARLELIKAVENQGVGTEILVIKQPGDQTPMRSDFHVLNLDKVEEGLQAL